MLPRLSARIAHRAGFSSIVGSQEYLRGIYGLDGTAIFNDGCRALPMITRPDGPLPSGALRTGATITAVSADVDRPASLIRGRLGRLLIQSAAAADRAVSHRFDCRRRNYSAFWLRFDGEIPDDEFRIMINVLPALIGIRAMTFLPFKLYRGLWRYAGLWDLRNIVAGVGASSLALFLLVHGAFGIRKYPRSVVVIDSVILVSLMGGARLGRRVHRELSYVEREKRVLILAPATPAKMIVRDMKTNPDYDYEPVGFVDDDARKIGARIHGVPVLGGRDQLPAYHPDPAPAGSHRRPSGYESDHDP